MFIYLSKKIAIPNNTTVRCLAWNKEQGYIACGGDFGLLKVLKLETGKDGVVKGLAAPNNLSMNQTLEGHAGAVEVVTWNEHHQKLTSSDQNGLIIVWMLFKGSWYEEMINNRNKSVVKGMAWSADGHKICIVYEDGAVIVGSVDGNRIWGKEIKGVQLSCVEWSPDGKILLFGLHNGEVHMYDRGGNMVSKLKIHCLTSLSNSLKIVAINWYNGVNGHVEPGCPCLLICYDNGRLQLMRDETDDDPVILDSGLQVVSAKWNHDGSIFAVAGQTVSSDESRANVIQFYTTVGEHIHSLKIPGKSIQTATWESGGLRIALAVDSFIYFANIRPSYKWSYFNNTVVYSYTKQDRDDQCVVFFNCISGEKYTKYMKHLILMNSFKDFCIFASKNDSQNESGQYALTLSNAIGIPLEFRFMNILPCFLTMNHSVIICASKETFYVWQYKTAKDLSMLEFSSSVNIPKRSFKERIFHVDENPTGAADEGNIEKYNNPEQTNDPICCICSSERKLIIARHSGILQQYDLPNMILSQRFNFYVRPSQIALSSNSSSLSIIDVNGILSLYNLETQSVDKHGRTTMGSKISFERKDIWDVKWALDNPDMFAIMEKTRMYIIRKLEPEEPVLCSGYICSFEDLQVKAVLLDDIFTNPDNPSKNDIIEMETKVLRNARQVLLDSSIEQASKFMDENSHPRLWKLLAEAALKKLELTTAENAFVRCKDYQGIQFAKKLKNLQNENLKKAEVMTFFKQFEEAEKLYLEMDRRDLAVGLRRKLGDWFRVIELLKAGGGIGSGIDVQMEEAFNAVGDYFIDRQKWATAVSYYEQGRNHEKLTECYYMLEDYDKLDGLVHELPENHILLEDIGNKFNAVGMCQQAVESYIKAGKVKTAVDCCVNLNQWNVAVKLAQKHNMKEISSLLTKYAQHLIEKNNHMQAIELYRKANMHLQAAQLAFKLAKEESSNKNNPLLMKKLYLVSAILVDSHHSYMRKPSSVGDKPTGKAAMALASMLEEDSLSSGDSDLRVVDQAWKGAEAYHLYALAQHQLYKGDVNGAMRTCIHLRDYDEYIDPEEIYSLLALSSAASHAFGTCSKAFIKLESMNGISADLKEKYEVLAMDIFSRNAPKDSRSGKAECIHCETLIPDWCSTCPSCSSKFPICIASGKPIHESQPWVCSQCRHHASTREISVFKNCPLCYNHIQNI